MSYDEEVATEIIDSFNELSNEIEISIGRLSQGEIEDLNKLFRSIHSIKGNAAMIQLHSIVDFTHSIEEVIESLRRGAINPSQLIAEVIQIGMDRLRDLHMRELLGHEFENLQEDALKAIFGKLAKANQDEVDHFCQEILKVLGADFIIEDDTTETDLPEELDCYTRPKNTTKQAFDLDFFRELAQQVDRQSRYWDGRSEQLHDWAQKVNAMRGYPVSSEQLSAATYLHDIGMSYVPNQILEKQSKLSAEELAEIRRHPLWGYNYLVRIQGWDEAATIILEHHERIDGKGYPNGNKGELIHDGAKILAIIDAFFSITNGRADRAHRKSVVRAISEINARIETQFDTDWVAAFNQVIKDELKSGAL